VASDGHLFEIAIRSSPQPPALGQVNFEFTVTTADGAPAGGLTLSAVPWMPQMGHGAPTAPTITDRGGGVFWVAGVSFFMAGEWELRTTLTGSADGGSISDTAEPGFQIP